MNYERMIKFVSEGHEQELIDSLNQEIQSLRQELKDAILILEMVQDNNKMPHKHDDKQDRLYCLSERASEFFEKYPEEKL